MGDDRHRENPDWPTTVSLMRCGIVARKLEACGIGNITNNGVQPRGQNERLYSRVEAVRENRAQMSSWRRIGLAALAPLASGGAIFVQQWSVDRYGLTVAIPEWIWVQLAIGWVFLLAGLAARRRRPESAIGSWMIAFALIWLTSLLFVAPLIAWHEIGMAVALYWVLFVILLTYPSGRPSKRERWVIAVWGLFVLGVATVIAAFNDFYATIDDPACCPQHLLLVEDNPALRDTVRLVAVIVGILAIVGLFAVMISRWRRASRPSRRQLTIGTLALPLMAILVFLPVVTETFGPVFLSQRQVLYLQAISLLVLPGVILTSLIKSRLTHARVADMMRELDTAATPEAVEERLGATLGSPDVRLLFRSEDGDALVGASGHEVSAPDMEGTLTEVDEGTFVLHDPALDEEFVQSAGRAARMAITNARLQAELRSQLIAVRESRRRLVDATDEARKRVERDLHDGAQQRLVTLSATLRGAIVSSGGGSADVTELLESAAREADEAIAELRELAHGVHPAILTQAGLGPAVSSLTDRAPIPVVTDITTKRFPEDVEATAYFFIAEGLANAFKHSGASEVHITAIADDDNLEVVVEDDGSGRVDAKGSGLRGLDDRVGAIGGSCEFGVGELGGAKLIARLPLAEDDS
jgi:signal transduction histidine kinase